MAKLTKNFFVCWAANRQDGSVAAPVESFVNREDAEATFYTRCGQAAKSGNVGDAVIFFTADGMILDQKGWNREEKEGEE